MAFIYTSLSVSCCSTSPRRAQATPSFYGVLSYHLKLGISHRHRGLAIIVGSTAAQRHAAPTCVQC